MVRLGISWAEKNAAADLLEESKKSVLAELAQKATGGVAERERVALASDVYQAHLIAMVNARRDANIARVNYDGAKAWLEMARSVESTRRAEMTLR